ncbi:MAG TPA: glycine/betaine ABC transporter ATP-binding protein [Cyanobacteria bacterium UBA11149]|nr:glycine/betaine ABC transporter ATP-binding protein [Cyanobacteria bacterium UBA11367]HBE58152.1 glycine/betaine ABC transporter ATP-binding protein [Cyanobacteria bacterium UBA11366]HBK64148.1 glycine/betaine ABC transporter ATP-binding protein [Cyanobacteria bacterium UBA11166]HBR75470.1 glycine/betaine ABC transporter ATP-binding protein [Cyanobacteria bacterium UBA11159]HBS71128.1 glycine/betaine ABC transporter ATP-binding protein [Cyanobacteria bacterium UBA11153]HBW88748.1 glycine/be
MIESEPKIIIENLIKIYGDNPRRALKIWRDGGTRDSLLQTTGNVLGIADVSLTVNRGELFVVMGLSGSGKSTLVRCINRLIDPTSGHIYIDNEDIAHLDEKRMREIRLSKISMVFQGFGLFPHKTVVENVEYGLKIRGIDKVKRREKAMLTLETVGLLKWADYFPAALSGGMQQRVGLARALATDGEILLMDEPFSALDPLIRREMQEELLALQAEFHKTIIFISHDIQEALKIGNRIAVMKDGYIVQVGTPEDIIVQPVNDYIRAFSRDVNRAQVIKTGSIARPTITSIIGGDSLEGALAKMVDYNLEAMYILDGDGKPVGILKRRLLEGGIEQGKVEINKVMETNFPVAIDSSTIENTLHLWQGGIPVAVVDEKGKFQGAIAISALLASLKGSL